MIVLEPMAHETIWGGQKLKRYFATNVKRIGHLYSVYARKGKSNRALNHKYEGKTLNEIFPIIKEKYGMEDYDFFPLTIAMTEADENLSIQVHPDDDVAHQDHERRGKRESWYFIDPPESGSIVCGCKLRDIHEIRRKAKENDYGEIINHMPVKSGEYVFVEPGTLHAITAGSLVYEIEEGADDTYRFYDYDRVDDNGRKRELHTEKALDCLRPSLCSRARRYPATGSIEEATYTTKKLENSQAYENESDTLECFTMIDGSAMADGVRLAEGMTAIMAPGESIVESEINLAIVSSLRKGI